MISRDVPIEQYPVGALHRSDWDVIVIGAGPAGSVAAAYLAGKGHQTLLLDKKTFPRRKVCGDGLNHDAQRYLDVLGLLDTVRSAGHEVETACTFSTGGLKLVVPGPYISLERRMLDAILANHAVQAGATFCAGKVHRLTYQEDSLCEILVDGLKSPLRPRYVILATGASIRLARSLAVLDRPFPSAVAARCYVQSKETVDCFMGSFVRPVLPGYGWIFPMGDGLFNMGVIAYYDRGERTGRNLKKRFAGFVQTFPPARKLLQSGRLLTELKAAPLRCGLPARTVPGKGNLLATGETIGTTFHLTGEGIGKAMETGALAAEVIHKALEDRERDIIGAFSKELDRKFRPKYQGFRTAESWVSHPWINDFMARRGIRSKYLQKTMINAITCETDLRKVFSPAGLLRSFWR